MADFGSLLDDGLAALGVVLVSFPGLAVFDALDKVGEESLRTFLAIVVLCALVAGPFYRRRGGDIGDLGSFVFALTAVEMCLGLVVPVAESLLDLGNPSPIGSPAGIALVGVAYLTAYWLVYRDGYDRAKAAVRR
ncbi:hypothetical protein [Halorussus pelagicus]|uniref:hypothetical protein n=1 Tax=Halorussus pelagicus TaxID=2505977 RepID=UPI000FFBFC82|nr:hypothetical protein [Halorussus pelagicus]